MVSANRGSVTWETRIFLYQSIYNILSDTQTILILFLSAILRNRYICLSSKEIDERFSTGNVKNPAPKLLS